MKKMRLFLLLFITSSCFAATASQPTCSAATGYLGGIQETCTNPNSTATLASVMVFTVDGTTPATNGLGTGASGSCTSCQVLSPVPVGSSEYKGYITLEQSVTLKLVAGVNGYTDSAVRSYTVTVPTQTVLATHFGGQCGSGLTSNCGPLTGVTPPPDKHVIYPTSPAFPPTNGGIWRLHDSGFAWSLVEPSNGTFNWLTVDAFIDACATHSSAICMIQFTMVPCWVYALYNGGNNPPDCGNLTSYGNATAYIPGDLGTGPYGSSPLFNTYVSTLLSHVTGNGNGPVSSIVHVYQLQNEANLCPHLRSTPANLYALINYPAQLIRAAVTNSVIGAPSMSPYSASGINCFGNGSSGGTTIATEDMSTWMALETANGVISDFWDFHDYLGLTSTTVDYPEHMWSTVGSQFLSTVSSISFWKDVPWMDSETSTSSSTSLASGAYMCPVSTPSNPPTSYLPNDCAGFGPRWQMLHECAQMNSAQAPPFSVDEYYWNQHYVNGPVGGTAPPVSMANAYYYIQKYLTSGSCAGTVTNPSGTTYTLQFTESGSITARFVWTSSEATGQTYTVPAGYTDYRDLAGGVTNVTPGQSISISTLPIMLEQNGTVPPILGPANVIFVENYDYLKMDQFYPRISN